MKRRKTIRRPRRGRPGELVRRHHSSTRRFGSRSAVKSPHAAALARIREDLREASAQSRRVAITHAEAKANADRAREDFLRAYDAGQREEVDALLLKCREADCELRLRQRELADCHSRLNRIEGEILSHERFA